jgi:hypothetical protein
VSRVKYWCRATNSSAWTAIIRQRWWLLCAHDAAEPVGVICKPVRRAWAALLGAAPEPFSQRPRVKFGGQVMTKRRDVLIAATTTVATIILTGVVITSILLLAIFIADPSPMKKPDRPTITPTSTAPLPL